MLISELPLIMILFDRGFDDIKEVKFNYTINGIWFSSDCWMRDSTEYSRCHLLYLDWDVIDHENLEF